MQHSPSWETLSFPASHEIPCLLWNLGDHYHIHKIASHVPVQGRSIQSMNPIQLLKIHFIIVLPSMSRSSKWPLSVRFPHQNPVCTSPFPSL